MSFKEEERVGEKFKKIIDDALTELTEEQKEALKSALEEDLNDI